MQTVGITNTTSCLLVFHCPRCGSLKADGVKPTTITPQLVERCREYAASDWSVPRLENWQPVAECITKPEEKP